MRKALVFSLHIMLGFAFLDFIKFDRRGGVASHAGDQGSRQT